MELLDVTYSKAADIVIQYGGGERLKIGEERKVKTGTNKFRLPYGELKIFEAHKRYLEKRKFDPDQVIAQWELTGTGNIAYLDGINYSRRILAPIFWNGEMVSFQTRDITERSFSKYITCLPEREIIHHKHILYGKFSDGPKRKGICVEGITDVWRLGTDAFATFGIKYTPQQVRVISKLFNEVVIIYDPDPQAQQQAWKLQKELEGKGLKKVSRHKIACDPGDLSQREADEMMHYLMK